MDIFQGRGITARLIKHPLHPDNSDYDVLMINNQGFRTTLMAPFMWRNAMCLIKLGRIIEGSDKIQVRFIERAASGEDYEIKTSIPRLNAEALLQCFIRNYMVAKGMGNFDK